MNWNLWRCGFSGNYTIPAMTLSYRMMPVILMVEMHPWLWWSSLLFDNHASWAEVRDTVPSAYEATLSILSKTGQPGSIERMDAEDAKKEAGLLMARKDNTSPVGYTMFVAVVVYFLLVVRPCFALVQHV